MSPNDEPGGRGREPSPELSLHGLSITPERPAARAEPLPPPAAGFTFVRELGRGGMGVVYEALDEAAGRRVAVKIIAQRLGQNAEAVERFEREARLAASIGHPNCVFVYGAHVIHGAAAISMELMSGESLEDRLRSREPIPTETAVKWAIEILDGLGAAHALGVVHRDVKPSNCFLTADGHVKVGDFGLSRSIDGDLGLTQSGAFIGSPLYASPEQVRGRALDQRADIYSAGATLYALLAGRPPHSGSSLGDVLAQIVSEDPPALATLRPGLPRGLDGVVGRALAKDPAKRFADCASFRHALLAYAPGSLTPATLGLRIGAYVIDSLIVSALYQVACGVLYASGVRFASPVKEMPWLPGDVTILPVVLTIAWFAVLESWFGTTAGKKLLGLRVVATDGARAALWRTSLRVVVFMTPSLVPQLVWGMEIRPFQSLVRLLPYLLSMLTMRKRNGYRGIHEFATGTRVLRNVPSDPEAAKAEGVLDPVRPPAAGEPEAIGPYTVESLIGTTPRGRVLTARDPGLRRSVWIHLGGDVHQSAEQTTRPACLRWLHHGEGPVRYDVYESPSGASLLEYAASGRTLPWPAALRHLMCLAEELEARASGVAVEQIWIDRTGRLRVLDFAMGEGGGAPLDPVEALGRTASLLLFGKPSPGAAIPHDLPVHAEATVRRLLGVDPPFTTVDEARATLQSHGLRPAVLSRFRRSGQIALTATWLVLLTAIILAACRQAGVEAQVRGLVSRPDRMKAAITAILLAGGFSLPSIVLAFALRGGLTFSMLGIRVRRRSGRLASRLRCLARSVIVSLPLLPLFAVAVFRDLAALPYLFLGAAALGSLIYVGCAIWSFMTPNEGPADIIARTRLVRR